MNGIIEQAVPNKDYLEFTYCKLTPTGKGLNQQVTMENQGNGCFKYTESNSTYKYNSNQRTKHRAS